MSDLEVDSMLAVQTVRARPASDHKRYTESKVRSEASRRRQLRTLSRNDRRIRFSMASPKRRENAFSSALFKLHQAAYTKPEATREDSKIVELQPPGQAASIEISKNKHANVGERRAFPRRDSGCVVAVGRLGKREQQTRPGITVVNQQTSSWQLHATHLRGELINISMNGIAFQLTEPLPHEERLVLRLAKPGFDCHIDARATVLRCMQQDRRSWQIVCQFEKNLTFQQTQTFGRSQFQYDFV